ncbi:MAG: bifunctional 5,10-methylenetetrahydrofolate dehydrogenase/5,10-methenyltetrahydrofolate cyclohydrolase [Patescibacteria group bacterium]|nr:bifunctional 5,10-methylenetetrahydrofolate dehydrogenase/5,10-methenyltetrahydrofolate cyclohydrolase [Patescibacteria group bacterium]MBU1870979.1 bifunctional 5,10-methylenetetrahydrofolate dehydrogenase/5,10-methenyltetrahydrofolate cyclohydrolase [Patescibacteria group bacterium]
MSKIINGQVLAKNIKDNIVQEITKLGNARPNLAIILVGERPDSALYVKLKEEEAKKIGIDTYLYKCEENISEQELLKIIKYLNEDKIIDAILVQLPLPDNLDTNAIIKTINQIKDVDGFHPDNLEKLLKNCDANKLIPPVHAVVLEILKSIDCKIKDKQVCIISNSDIFGQTLSYILKCQGANVEAIKSDNKNLTEKTSQADILITAVGKPKFIKKEIIKQGAVIIDIGISYKDKKVFGDVDFEDVKDKVNYITPVPGGVGPMTIAMAFKNTLEIYKKRHEK